MRCGVATTTRCPHCRKPICSRCIEWYECDKELLPRCGRETCPGPCKKRVFVCSRLRAETYVERVQNKRAAYGACLEVIAAGHAPFAPHMFYTNFLNDDDPREREAGIACGQTFLAACDETWVYGSNPIPSAGMQSDIRESERRNIPVIFRRA